MSLRLGPGPVFVYEWLTTARRWQTYAIRAAFVGFILAGMALVSHQLTTYRFPGGTVPLRELAAYGQSIYLTIAIVELSMVLLVAPAATAGAVCLDKARGTLDHMLATDLSNAEIVLGKLGVRLVPVLNLIACLLPVVALSALLGGIDPLALFGSFLTAIGCAVVGCSLALTLSVWGRKPHEVLIATYMILVLWLIYPGLVRVAVFQLGHRPPFLAAPRFWQFVLDTHPYYLICAPYLNPGKVDLWTFLAFLVGCLATSAGLAGLSTWRIRRVALSQAGRPSVERRRWWPRWSRPWWLPTIPGPSLDDEPVAWREWHRMRPSRLMRAAWGLYGALGLLWFAMSFRSGSPMAIAEDEGMLIGSHVALGLLLLSVTAATSLAEERVQGSLDVLLSTPISSREILAGKWWGSFRQVVVVAFWPALIGARLLLSEGSPFHYLLLLGSILAYGAAIASLGLAMATWVSRLGRAVAGCVAIYVVWSIGLFVVVGVFVDVELVGRDLLVGCPLVGSYMATVHLGERDAAWLAEYRGAAVIWILVYAGLASGLFAATAASFDRCLGRMPEGDLGWSPPGRVHAVGPASRGEAPAGGPEGQGDAAGLVGWARLPL